jgi:hypothetical protein
MATLHAKMVAVVGEPTGKALRGGKTAWSAEQLKQYAIYVTQQKSAAATEMEQLLGAFQAVSLAAQPAAPATAMDALESAMAGLGLGGQKGGRRYRKSRRVRHRHRRTRRHH